ncbi:TrmH family RNA methyltransferase [Maribellus comscasis]|uniref:tRNA (guanosine(18)-2'-O)-methyltransferase n=1 Tax=Maribellus comscasis TaxID=2681766 RepID=A0A6I6JN95_9BACT|nr:RNA methyltransferase [Maribellus comscasis]QGY42440.1 TrmH family RNA methyltransferase [Maribellus comscasis]
MLKNLLGYLSKFVTPARLALFEKVLNERTNYITVVLEDIFQPQNASAVLRSCDCFGIQNVHVIENRNEFSVNKEVSLGSSKWLSIQKYNKEEHNSLKAIKKLKKDGYRIIATTPHANDQTLHEFDVEKGKAALVFGSELPGVSEVIMSGADEFLKIPMYGFTESFNISVSAALVLYEISNRLRELDSEIWKLSENEKDEIKLEWIRATVKQSQLLEERFYTEMTKGQD